MVYIHPDVSYWVMDKVGRHIEGMTAIGDIKDGKLIAGVAFEGQNKNCIWGNMRIDSSPSKAFWVTLADFIFNQAGCKRFSSMVEVDNEKAIKLNLKIGFIIEATLKDAVENGDVHIMTLWKDNCRMLDWKIK